MKKITVKDLGEVITGHTPPTSKREYYGDYYPFLKPTDMIIGSKYTYFTEEGYSELAYNKYKNSLIPKGATCVVCIGTLGEKMCMAHCDLFTNQSVNSIIPNEKFEEHYVFYLLKYNLHRVKALNKGTASGREFVSKTTFLDLEIDVHEDFQIQKKIGELLSAYDNLIENNQKQIKLLEEAAQRLYKEWFVDLHFPGFEKVKIVDGVPEGWTNGTLGDIAFFKRGKTITKAQVQDGDVPVVAGGLEPAYYHNKSNTFAPVITVSGSGANAGFARLYNVNVFASDCSFADSKTTPFLYFVYCFIKDNKQSFDALQKGSAQPHVYAKDINALKLSIPTEVLLESFCELVSPYFEKIKVLQNQIALSSQARDRLLPKLMSGEIEV
ncbi:MAG: restriction endonuclease subunit S [Erysipelotrichaceae bacterium]